ncbi:MAG: hypothetical protein LBC85_07000 [Fibromonadaceae bacterium]|jgi:hypothetical protein|nr:hypothetical protein [Fibromonadaceae bacterium]
MKFFFLFLLLCLLGCVEEYSDSIEIRQDGSAVFQASLYPSDLDSNLLISIREDYTSIPGVKFDTAWFEQKDSAYSLNFRVLFKNLLTWESNEKIEQDFVGYISLKKIDTLKNGYSFERILNVSIEGEDGYIIPEESISEFAMGLMNDSAFWEYSVILPKSAVLINSEPIDMAVQSEDPNILRWKVPATEAIAKRITLKADYYLPAKESQQTSLIPIIAGIAIMLLAIALLLRKLKNLGVALRRLRTEEETIANH